MVVQHGSCFLRKPFTLRTGYRDTLIGWSAKTFVPQLLTCKVHGVDGSSYTVVKRFLPSLKAAGLPLYRDYDEVERAILAPATRFRLRTFADPGTRTEFRLGFDAEEACGGAGHA